ncbi:phytanoyl-CoA dioxygenase family protein [Rhizobiaceae bacterium n13]|uniref:Phytanoyl-CoA dioxygenase family protein n=1 Tax=Ferirhizobium litorale TaxID=2927786 RepID=A0AAE3QJJ8_9HYPH|nr:phytanoyl-CoA dioxygenase family protein [Fererhizobium litorale]MDI7863880.1 phytanoyl-CoA dioxygenase family protein [Fererhizobium litorale]MDI7924288.1 phytanoyl-CoA dioxygenase family protein [Fererhizobium litorale]
MRASSFLLSPIYMLQLASGAKSFADNPIIGSKWLNRKGLHVGRVSLAMKMAAWRRKRLEHLVDDDHRQQYEENGFVRIENFLPADVFARVQEELANADFERYDMLQGSTVTRRALIDQIDLEGLPGFKAARNDPRLANLLRYVSSHHGQPLLVLQVVMALPSEKTKAGAADPQTALHSDTFQPTAKAWLFLRDVDEDDGPFAYVPGSHKVTPQRMEWEKKISENADAIANKYSARGSLRIMSEDLGALGYRQPVPMVVKANTLIVADTHGFHARTPSYKETTRVEIYGSLRRNPFLPFTGLHIASLPAISSTINRRVINALAFTQKLGIKGSPWKDVGRGKADEWSTRLTNL